MSAACGNMWRFMTCSTWGVVAVVVAASTGAQARPYRGIEPGKSRQSEVSAAFGDPPRVTTVKAKKVLAYLGYNTIPGTTQVQFRMGTDGVVERIDVFPDLPLTRADIEASYGPPCEDNQPAEGCHISKAGGEQKDGAKKVQLHYVADGLAVFLRPDGLVLNLVYLPPEKVAPRRADR